ncbi:hypothetical protein GIB67_008678, partial [Kingdonia uniflora]
MGFRRKKITRKSAGEKAQVKQLTAKTRDYTIMLRYNPREECWEMSMLQRCTKERMQETSLQLWDKVSMYIIAAVDFISTLIGPNVIFGSLSTRTKMVLIEEGGASRSGMEDIMELQEGGAFLLEELQYNSIVPLHLWQKLGELLMLQTWLWNLNAPNLSLNATPKPWSPSSLDKKILLGRNARNKLDIIQHDLRNDPLNDLYTVGETEAMKEFTPWVRAEESLKKQKSRVDWLGLGDGNTVFFPCTWKKPQQNWFVLCTDGVLTNSGGQEAIIGKWDGDAIEAYACYEP